MYDKGLIDFGVAVVEETAVSFSVIVADIDRLIDWLIDWYANNINEVYITKMK